MNQERALVLGGGGPAGVAWESGLAAGLARGGVLIAEADSILGTSAGSYVGANLAGGRDPEAFAQSQLRLAAREGDAAPVRPSTASNPGSDMQRLLAAAPPDEAPPQALRAEIGAVARAKARFPLDVLIASFGATAAPGRPWPERFACTAVDTETGAFKIWRAADAAPLGMAIAASCSVPGFYPPAPVHGRLWMDGGVRSPTNLDCAAGFARALCVAVITGASGARARAQLEAETRALEGAGARVAVITPDERSIAALGSNLMFPVRRGDIIEAGIAQGEREAETVKGFWH